MASLSQEFLDMLRCPATGQRLQLADARLVERLNDAIAAGKLQNSLGQSLSRRLDGALVREDGQAAYQIVDELPILLVDEAIPLSQLDQKFLASS